MILRASLYANLLLLIACVALYALWQHDAGELARVGQKRAEAIAEAAGRAREAERKHAEDMAAIGEQYEQDKRAGDEAQRRLVGDLRAGTVRLQKRWAGCVSDLGATAAERDAAARDREQGALDLVRAGRDADDKLRACQRVIRADRGQ